MPFRDLAGHRRLLELTARAAVRGSLPPSLIFAGPDGVGKRHAAIALAQLFNCASPSGAVQDADGGSIRRERERASRRRLSEGGSGAGLSGVPASDGVAESERRSPSEHIDACGSCSSCRRISRGVHADVMIVEPGDTGSIKVEQARQVIDGSAYRPFEGRRRVVIIDDADAMEASAQNALLKTLEEPPPASTFVLVTSRPDALLPTVRSRCQRVRFGALSPADVAAVLVRDHGFTEADAHAAAAVADGSVGQALEGDTEAYVEAREAAAALLNAVVRATDARQRLAAAKALGGDRVDRDELGRRLRLVSSILRDLGVLLSRADARALANGDMTAGLQRLLPSFDGDRAVRAFSAVDRAAAALDRNASPKIVADWLAFQI